MTRGIRFPKMHIATSVVNRILNVADGLGMGASSVREPPEVPNVGPLGDRIVASATAPTPELEGDGSAITGQVARGDDLVDGI